MQHLSLAVSWRTDILPAMTEGKQQAWRTFLTAHAHVVRQLEQELVAEADLSLAWYDALFQLHEAGGRIRVGELADRLIISRSATTRFVDRLERAGLLEREVCDDDRRGTWAVLTAHGEATLRRAAPTHMRGIKQHFTSKITDADADQLRLALDAIIAE